MGSAQMLKYIREYRFYIILFFFILLPVLAIDTSTRSPREYRFYDRVIVGVTSPVQVVITWVLDSCVSAYNNYVYLWETRKHNEDLLNENRKLLTTIVNLRETQEENRRLRRLLSFKEDFKLDTVVARVIARDVTTEFRAIRINRGESHGIQKDMPVVTSSGIVGRVFRTTNKTADVITVLDLLSAVDIIVKRSRVRGIIEGFTEDVAQMKFALRTDDILPGDLLISSGLGGIFPKGVSVGRVSKVQKKPYGISQFVEVEPSVDFSRLEEVLIITRFPSSPVHLETIE